LLRFLAAINLRMLVCLRRGPAGTFAPLQRTPWWTAGIISAPKVGSALLVRFPTAWRNFLLGGPGGGRLARSTVRLATAWEKDRSRGLGIGQTARCCFFGCHARASATGACMPMPRLVATSTHGMARKDRVACRWAACHAGRKPVSLAESEHAMPACACESPPTIPRREGRSQRDLYNERVCSIFGTRSASRSSCVDCTGSRVNAGSR
jgi:hypothetical protein